MSIRTPVVLLVTVLAATFSVSAEQTTTSPAVSEQVPLDVVMRVLGLESREQLVLGAMPQELVRKLALPSGIDVVATVTHEFPHGFHYQVFATSRMPKNDLVRVLASSLQRSGWTEPPTQATWWWGSSVAPRTVHGLMQFCSAEDWHLHAAVQEHKQEQREGPTSLRISVQGGQHGSLCADAGAGGDQGWGWWINEAPPTLEPQDEGAVAASLEGRSSDGFREIHARIVSEVAAPATAQVDRYAKQLVDAGWAVGETVTSSRMAIAEVSLETTDERVAVGFLIAHCGRQDRHSCDVSVMVYRDR